jgi:hypothetical protein
MRTIRTAATLAALTLAAACGDGAVLHRERAYGSEAASAVGYADLTAPEEAQQGEPTARLPEGSLPSEVDTGAVLVPEMIIRNGTARIRVDSLEVAMAAARRMAQEAGGFVANAEIQSGDREVRRATLQVRLPAANFDRLVSGLSPLGRVESVNVSAQDVGEEFTDAAARLENARRLEERLLELLRTRTGNLADVLAAERELARVREQSERLEGRMRYLRSKVAVSTFVIHLYEPGPLVGGRPGANPIAEALRQAWRNFVGVVAFLIASLGVVVPLGLLALVLVWILRRVRPWLPRRAPAPLGSDRGPRSVSPDDESQAAD